MDTTTTTSLSAGKRQTKMQLETHINILKTKIRIDAEALRELRIELASARAVITTQKEMLRECEEARSETDQLDWVDD